MFGIGKLSTKTGVKIPTIRYYEDIGILPAPERSAGNQRRYLQYHVERLLFIRHARDLGFSIEAIKELLQLSDHPQTPCSHVDKIAEANLKQVEQKIKTLTRLREELRRMLDNCNGGTINECHILEVISDHTHCKQDH